MVTAFRPGVKKSVEIGPPGVSWVLTRKGSPINPIRPLTLAAWNPREPLQTGTGCSKSITTRDPNQLTRLDCIGPQGHPWTPRWDLEHVKRFSLCGSKTGP